MCGIQLDGGEWMLGAETTARYGGGLMWLASVVIIGRIFYKMECGRYALYTGEPVFTGFMQVRPGPQFWVGALLLLSLGAFNPGLSTQAAAVLCGLILDRVPGEEDRWLVTSLAFVLLGAVTLTILVGGNIDNVDAGHNGGQGFWRAWFLFDHRRLVHQPTKLGERLQWLP